MQHYDWSETSHVEIRTVNDKERKFKSGWRVDFTVTQSFDQLYASTFFTSDTGIILIFWSSFDNKR